jgi:DMSO/TMAO reductase YedYZ molybdopterin-dependent catalytic subunit
MQVLKQHKRIVLIAVLLVAVLIVSLFIVQYVSKPSLTHVPSPTPAPSAIPTGTSPTPTGITSPVPTVQAPPSPPRFPPITSAPTLVPSSGLYPGEVTQYQNQSLTPISSFINAFLQTSINGAQNINQATYVLTVTGLVNQTLKYTYNEVVNNFQAHQEVVPIICVEGWSANILWEGVAVSDLLQEAGVSPQANTLIFYASDGYSTALPLNYVTQNNLILAYKINNVTLNAQTGWPFILVAQNQYGYKWIKYLTEIDVSNNPSYLGYWESRGYPNNATISSSNNATPSSSGVAAAETVGVYAAGTIMAAALYFTLIKINTKRSKSWKNRERSKKTLQ